MFLSPTVKEDRSGHIDIERTTLSTGFGLPIWLMADEKRNVYTVMNPNHQPTSVKLNTPDGELKTDVLPLGRVIYQPKSEKTLDVLCGMDLGRIDFTAKTRNPEVFVNNVRMPNENLKAQGSGVWSFTING